MEFNLKGVLFSRNNLPRENVSKNDCYVISPYFNPLRNIQNDLVSCVYAVYWDGNNWVNTGVNEKSLIDMINRIQEISKPLNINQDDIFNEMMIQTSKSNTEQYEKKKEIAIAIKPMLSNINQDDIFNEMMIQTSESNTKQYEKEKKMEISMEDIKVNDTPKYKVSWATIDNSISLTGRETYQEVSEIKIKLSALLKKLFNTSKKEDFRVKDCGCDGLVKIFYKNKYIVLSIMIDNELLRTYRYEFIQYVPEKFKNIYIIEDNKEVSDFIENCQKFIEAEMFSEYVSENQPKLKIGDVKYLIDNKLPTFNIANQNDIAKNMWNVMTLKMKRDFLKTYFANSIKKVYVNSISNTKSTIFNSETGINEINYRYEYSTYSEYPYSDIIDDSSIYKNIKEENLYDTYDEAFDALLESFSK